jgi:hypothetical protein
MCGEALISERQRFFCVAAFSSKPQFSHAMQQIASFWGKGSRLYELRMRDITSKSLLKLALFAIAISFGLWFAITQIGDDSAGVYVQYVGAPATVSIRIEAGTCSEVQPSLVNGKTIQYADCGTWSGTRRLFLKCGNPTLPEAALTLTLQSGSTSNLAWFSRVCEKTPQQIESENERVNQSNSSIWGDDGIRLQSANPVR